MPDPPYHLDELGVGAHVRTRDGLLGEVKRRERSLLVIVDRAGEIHERPATDIEHLYTDATYKSVIPPRVRDRISGRGTLLKSGTAAGEVAYDLSESGGGLLDGSLYLLGGDPEEGVHPESFEVRLEDGRIARLEAGEPRAGVGGWAVRGFLAR